MKKNMNDFYEFLASNEDLKEKISLNQFIKAGEKLDKEKLKKIISTEIIPVAKKNGFDLTTEEILNKELPSQGTLTEENLADVSGGVKPKTAGIILSLLTVGTGVISSATNLAAFAAEKAETSEAPIIQEVENLDLTDTSKGQEAPQDNGIPKPPPPPAPAPPPPPGAPAPIVSSKVSIPQGFSKIDMPDSNEEIKKLIKIDLPEDFEKIKEECILLKDGEDIVLYNTDIQKLWTEDQNSESEPFKWSNLHLYNLRKGQKLKKAHTQTQEERDKERETREAEKRANKDAQLKKLNQYIKDNNISDQKARSLRGKFREGKLEIYQKEDGTFEIKDVEITNDMQKSTPKISLKDIAKKTKLDASKLDASSALGMFDANIKALAERKQDIINLSAKGIDLETTEQAKNMVAKFNEILEDVNASSGRILELYTEARQNSEKSPITLKSTLLKLRENYTKLSTEYNAILKIYSRFGLDAKNLGLVDLPQSPLPLPKKVEFKDVSFTYSDEENKFEVSSKPGQKVSITLELLKTLGVRDIDKYTGKPVTVELSQSYELDEDCSKLLELKFDLNGVSGFVKRAGTPSLEEVYAAMKNGTEKELLKDLPVYSNSHVTYNAKPEAKKVSVEEIDSKALLDWKKDQNDNLTAKKGRSTITYNVSTGLFEVTGSAVVLEQEDINSIESVIGKKLEKIEYKVKGKIILGQSLLNSGWVNSTGYFFGNYSYSRISNDVKMTSVEDVIMYKYTDGSVYLEDNRDDKSQPIVLNESDIDKIEKEFGSTKLYSKSKFEVKTNSNNWTKHNSWRYYGFEKR